jgi:hypothetical protein
MRSVEACIESHGKYFEHLLQMYSFIYNSQIKCFRTHVDTDFIFLLWYVELVPTVCPHFSVTLRILEIVERASLSKSTINDSADIQYINQPPFKN